jgi:hypothetical protein
VPQYDLHQLLGVVRVDVEHRSVVADLGDQLGLTVGCEELEIPVCLDPGNLDRAVEPGGKQPDQLPVDPIDLVAQ